MATQTRAETHVYLDMDALMEKEDPQFTRIVELAISRDELALEEKRAKAARAKADTEIKEFLESYSADGLVTGDLIVDVVTSRSGGKWDKPKLMRILTPDQIEGVYSEGTPYTYIKSDVSEEKVLLAKQTI